MTRILPFVFVLLLAGCGACPLPSEQPMQTAQLYFGRNIPGGGTVSDADWSAFAAGVLTLQFPDGFTAYDSVGQWRDPVTRVIGREPTKVVMIAADQSTDLSSRLMAVIDAYRRKFKQESVGLTTGTACGQF